MPDISLPLGLLKKPIEAVGALALGESKTLFARLKAEKNLKTLYQKLNSTQRVKTIWNVDRPISLNSFYYPAKIRGSTGNAQTIAGLNELPSNAVVLSGTVGQGKSILLRHLVGKEIRSGERVPLLIELRRIADGHLYEYIKSTFAELMDVKRQPDIFDAFAASGRVSLLLDGFDEVDPEQQQMITAGIESLATRFPSARIVVTSRPQSGIENSPLFDVVYVAPLEDRDLPDFFCEDSSARQTTRYTHRNSGTRLPHQREDTHVNTVAGNSSNDCLPGASTCPRRFC
jgi:predicted NACHT family NTPase